MEYLWVVWVGVGFVVTLGVIASLGLIDWGEEFYSDEEVAVIFGTYSARAKCENCGFSGVVKLVKGNEVEDEPCPNCDTVGLYTGKGKKQYVGTNRRVSQGGDSDYIGNIGDCN